MTKDNKALPVFRITKFIKEETLGGVLLIISTVIAVILANSDLQEVYNYVLHDFKLGFSVGDFSPQASLQHWVNDLLMAVFFFTIGLEIKREIMGGELSSMKKATFPLMAAVGGMLIPAIIYVMINAKNPDYASGWGIPMATDIAFALGLVAMLGSRVNINLKIFLTALAIADDLGAILVIAAFYTETINYLQLFIAGIALLILITGNRMGVRSTFFYAFIGFLGVWLAFIFSGIHATIAGVLIAFTIPSRAKVNETDFFSRLSGLLEKFNKAKSNTSTLLTSRQAHLIDKIEKLSFDAHTPLQRLEHLLHPVAAYFIIPLFALCNAGVSIDGNVTAMILHPISIGIIAGLVAGKFIGISLFAHLAVKLKLAVLPDGVTWKDFYGVSFLAGIGFTMSIFISGLAFSDPESIQIAKVGIFAASVISAAIGMTILATGETSKKGAVEK